MQLHSRQHDFLPFFCLLCEDELPSAAALQRHLDQHMIYSVQCKFCDRSFLNRNLTEHHIKIAHRDKRKRRIFRHKLILARVDKDEIQENSYDSLAEKNNFQVFFVPYTDMVVEVSDIDMTELNLKEKNIELYSGEGMEDMSGSHEEESAERDECSLSEVNNLDEGVNIESTVDETVNSVSDCMDNVSDLLNILEESVDIEPSIHDGESIDFEVNTNNKEDSNLDLLNNESNVNTDDDLADIQNVTLNSPENNVNDVESPEDDVENK